jgi:hypothetical protein
MKNIFNHEPHGLYTDFTRTLHGLYTDFTRTLHGLYTDFTRTLHGLYTDFTRTLHGLYTDFTRTLHGLYTDDRSGGLLCAKVGFTQLRRRRYGAPAARRHEAGFPLSLLKTLLKNQKSSKRFSKMRKTFKASNLRIVFLKIFHKKQDSG